MEAATKHVRGCEHFTTELAKITTPIVEKWPEIEIEERSREAYKCYCQVHDKIIEFALENKIKMTAKLCGELVYAALEDSRDTILGEKQSFKFDEKYQLVRNQMNARLEQIITLIQHESRSDAQRRISLPHIVVNENGTGWQEHWGQHGAHFPNLNV